MKSLGDLKAIIGEDTFNRLSEHADGEVGGAMRMELIDPLSRQERYYRQTNLFPTLIDYYDQFRKLNLSISPWDVVDVLFKCKLLFAVQNEQEYCQRVGGWGAGEEDFMLRWADKSLGLPGLLDASVAWIDNSVATRSLVVEISNFYTHSGDPTNFFEELGNIVGTPLTIHLDGEASLVAHKIAEPHLRPELYTERSAKQYFCSPSISSPAFGSREWSYRLITARLRTTLNVLRIANFIHPGQVSFTTSGVSIAAPTSPVFLGDHAQGCYSWHEHEKNHWERIPDGSLFLSFGHRGLSQMYLDERTFGGMKKLFEDGSVIFSIIQNPFTKVVREEIEPILEILSSATQMQDLGAKILLVYTCLEHLFVPPEVKNHNQKYIIGGLKALQPSMIPWFNEMYQLRCDYAHKGFVGSAKLGLVQASIENAYRLLIAKLNASGRPVI